VKHACIALLLGALPLAAQNPTVGREEMSQFATFSMILAGTVIGGKAFTWLFGRRKPTKGSGDRELREYIRHESLRKPWDWGNS